jgi:hypothetical protein
MQQRQQRIQSSHRGVRKKLEEEEEEEEEHTRVDRHHPLPPVVAVVAYPCLLLLVSSGAAADAFPFPPSASPLTNLSLSSLGRSSLSKKNPQIQNSVLWSFVSSRVLVWGPPIPPALFFVSRGGGFLSGSLASLLSSQ